MDNFKGYRTYIVAAAVFAIGGLQALNVADLVPADYTGIALAVVGALMAALRKVTATA